MEYVHVHIFALSFLDTVEITSNATDIFFKNITLIIIVNV
jgi:hypothetical protein